MTSVVGGQRGGMEDLAALYPLGQSERRADIAVQWRPLGETHMQAEGHRRCTHAHTHTHTQIQTHICTHRLTHAFVC